ncbi:MAG: VOC family protein [Calothrix sp. MO_192.B10]|nr:VOC family protein [Calothrix sp. MO_192.B10]
MYNNQRKSMVRYTTNSFAEEEVKMKKTFMYKMVVASITFLVAFFALFSYPSLATAAPLEVNSYLFKVNVSSLEKATDFYSGKLGMERDTSRDTDVWTQFFFKSAPGTKVGTYISSSTGTGEATLTFVVPDIESARQYLINKGVQVSPSQNVGAGVLLAFFKDFDGNQLTLRENLLL